MKDRTLFRKPGSNVRVFSFSSFSSRGSLIGALFVSGPVVVSRLLSLYSTSRSYNRPPTRSDIQSTDPNASKARDPSQIIPIRRYIYTRNCSPYFSALLNLNKATPPLSTREVHSGSCCITYILRPARERCSTGFGLRTAEYIPSRSIMSIFGKSSPKGATVGGPTLRTVGKPLCEFLRTTVLEGNYPHSNDSTATNQIKESFAL